MSAEDNTLYRIEGICGRRYFGKKLQYLVKWEGYDKSGNTYEYAYDIADKCPKFIKQFERERKEKALEKRRRKEVEENESDGGQPLPKRRKYNMENDRKKPYKIFGIIEKESGLLCVMEFHKTKLFQVLELDDVRKASPQLLIDYLLKHSQWTEE